MAKATLKFVPKGTGTGTKVKMNIKATPKPSYRHKSIKRVA